MTFKEVYNQVERSSSEAAFNKEECIALYGLCSMLAETANVVEIGVQFGRSATVIGSCAKERGFNFVAIDNWGEDVSSDAKRNVETVLLGELGLPIDLWSMSSTEASKKYYKEIDLIHIDGDHTYKGVSEDIANWLPKVKQGGYLLFDDYGHDSLPDVYKAVQRFSHFMEFVGRYGNKLGVFRKK